MGQPAPWEFRLQQAATPVMENIIWFHNFLLVVITLIVLLVLGLLIAVAVKFNARANPIPSRTTHHTLIEVIWTVVPILVLVGIAGAVVSSAVSRTRRSQGRSDDQGDRQAVVLDLFLPDKRQIRIRFAIGAGQAAAAARVSTTRWCSGGQGGPGADHRRRRDPLLLRCRRSVSRSTRCPGRLNETLVQGNQDRDVLRPVLGNCAARITPSCRSRCGW